MAISTAAQKLSALDWGAIDAIPRGSGSLTLADRWHLLAEYIGLASEDAQQPNSDGRRVVRARMIPRLVSAFA